jgi:hypothetical protein
MITKLSMVRGDTTSYTLNFSNEQGQPINITGWVLYFTLKQSWQLPDSQASLQKTITNHSDPTNGITTLQISHADTYSLYPRDYDFDIEAVDTSGNVYTILRGKFTIDYDVTGTAGTAGT